MTPEEFTRRLPLFTTNPLPTQPPFGFNSLSVRAFPLRASLDALQQVCNSYLNFVPPEVGRFRAVVPYVYLAILDYGQITAGMTNIGWFAQVEVFFCVPVEWYKVVNGKWVFHDWAVITPFIYVDDDISVPQGRTIYGFPKALGRVTPAASRWLTDPVAPVTLAQVETSVFPELYQGKRLESRVFLEVERKAPMSNFRVPPDMHSPLAPWAVASNVAEAIQGFGLGAMWLAQSMRISPVNPAASPAFAPQMLAQMAPWFAPGGDGFGVNSLNLKQFRRSDIAPPEYFDATRPPQSQICYQGLTNGRMQITAFNGGGLLGEDRTLLGDLSGGHTIKLHEYVSLPIVRTLGLDVHRRWRGDGVDVAELKPVAPFWVNVNVQYQKGVNLAWRSRDGIWKDGSGSPVNSAGTPAADSAAARYNTTVASVIDAVAGPFQFSGTTIRVLPLLAHRAKLQAFLDGYINEPLRDPIVREDGKGEERVRLSVWARPPAQVNAGPPIGGDFAYVYLAASSYESVTSKTNNIGDWAKYELEFLIPVKWERQNADGSWRLHGVGLVPAYSFMDNSVGAISRLEVLGIPTVGATFVRPESVWLNETESGIDAKQMLLRVDAEVIPALGVGQKTSMHTLMEISARDAGGGLGDAGQGATRPEWAEALRLELGTKKGTKAKFPDQCKIARALALEVLGNRVPLSLYTLKQFRDVVDPLKACYQALERVPWAFKEIIDLREIEETIVVRLHDFPTIKIVDSLGILGTTPRDADMGIVYDVQAVRPFYIRATIDQSVSERLLDRAGTSTWSLSNQAFQSILSDEDGAPPITADRLAETLQDQSDPSRMAAIMYQARGRLGQSDQAITKEEARLALAMVDPQMVIDSVLSREWGNTGDDARWRRGRRELLRDCDTLILGASSDVAGVAQALSFEFANSKFATRPGHTEKLSVEVDDFIGRLKQFAATRQQMEGHFNQIAQWAITRLLGSQNAAALSREPSSQIMANEVSGLVSTLSTIANLEMRGEPSPHNNLDMQVSADFFRLGELVVSLEKLLANQPPEVLLEYAWVRREDFRSAVVYARRYCDVQREALLNKLSRAYQKPDFCIRRDALGPEADRLLPVTLSWDEDWYSGKMIDLDK